MFVGYTLEKPKYDVDECRQRGMTFAAPIKVTIQLIIYDSSGEGSERLVRDIKEQEVYFGEIPLMTENGTFIINGTERVVVSQLHRSPGVFFDHDRGKTHSSGKLLYQARIIPYRGSWLDFEFDPKDLIYVRIDRRRKMPATVLLKALGYSAARAAQHLLRQRDDLRRGRQEVREVDRVRPPARPARDARHQDRRRGRSCARTASSRARRSASSRKPNLDRLPIDPTEIVGQGQRRGRDRRGDRRGPARRSTKRSPRTSSRTCARPRSRVQGAVHRRPQRRQLPARHAGRRQDQDRRKRRSSRSTGACARAIRRRSRPRSTLFHNLFFNPERYDLSKVGRLKLNYKFYKDDKDKVPLEIQVLTKQDIIETVRHLIHLKNSRGTVDDIDHLGNRRVRAVGELMENQYRIGLVRMERAIKERMSMSQELETLMPHDLINAKPVSAVVKEYFGSSQLSQFMDQTNPLSEVTHKRRLSALGPGGLTRERAGFEVRDVHATHYGRICPIETPEGPNIGLIASLSTYARVNEYGFVETPYRKVEGGKVTHEVRWYSALEEENHYIAQANATIDEKRQLDGQPGQRSLQRRVRDGAAGHDHADGRVAEPAGVGRGLADPVPRARRREPRADGLEHAAPGGAADAPVRADRRHRPRDARRARLGRVHQSRSATAWSSRSKPRASSCAAQATTNPIPDIHRLTKFQRSNQGTCYNQKPVVRAGRHASRRATCSPTVPAIERGELALGQNVVVAFMPWGGYNFEDSILISERVMQEDVFTSIHIEEFECVARDTKLGKEEITRDIPNVGEESLKDIDESGIVRIGAEVEPGDVLVGKITPKGETQLTPEEKLLRAIFGEKAGDVRDSSLRVPPGVSRHRDQRARVRAQGHGEGRARQGDRGRRARQVREGHGGRDQDRARERVRPDLEAPDRPEDRRPSWSTTRATSCSRKGVTITEANLAADAAQAARRDRGRRRAPARSRRSLDEHERARSRRSRSCTRRRSPSSRAATSCLRA